MITSDSDTRDTRAIDNDCFTYGLFSTSNLEGISTYLADMKIINAQIQEICDNLYNFHMIKEQNLCNS